jgi:hypothetical protein
MGNQKLIKIGVKKDKNGFDVIQTKLQDEPRPCKECGKELRINGSSRCQKCIERYKLILYDQKRLQQKVEKQTKLIA